MVYQLILFNSHLLWIEISSPFGIVRIPWFRKSLCVSQCNNRWYTCFFNTHTYHKQPGGGKTAPAFWALWKKKCRFRHSETADSFPKMVLKIPGILKWFFNNDLKFTGNLCLKTRAIFFPLTLPYDSFKAWWPPSGLWSWSSSNATATPGCFASTLG